MSKERDEFLKRLTTIQVGVYGVFDPLIDRDSLNKMPKPTFLRTAKERAQLNHSRCYIRTCLRILKQNTGHLPYTESAMQGLIDEYERMSDLLADYDSRPKPPFSTPTAELESVLSFLGNLPELLINQRLARALSQGAVADQAGIGRPCYNGYERNDFADTSLARLIAIARVVCDTSAG